MKIINNKNKLIKLIHKEKKLGFIPTMGSIHLGHISLIKKASQECNKTIVSIFINRPQFNKKSDFDNYPRSQKKDISILKRNKVDYLYIPSVNQIYPKDYNKNIKISSFKNELCGRFRPGHFESVVDVVNRFLRIIKPKNIYLGEKDMQQLMIVEEFIKRNHIKVKVVGCKTVRDKKGLPLSSRNFLLTKKQKKIGSDVYKLLKNNKKRLINNINYSTRVKKMILNLGIKKIDYIEVVNINKIIKPFNKKNKFKIFIAYYLDKVRLIDNI